MQIASVSTRRFLDLHPDCTLHYKKCLIHYLEPESESSFLHCGLYFLISSQGRHLIF